ncbi:MAG: PASTA domain-containing protein [Desulfobacterales bacterium]|nr:PASTA domain-containing protein [Desulfobacterales bacterium]
MFKRILKISALVMLFIGVAGISAYLTLTMIIKSEDTVVVPNLVGKDVVHCLELLSDLGLNTKVKGSEFSPDTPKNYVIFQEPGSGEEIKKGRDVRIVLSKGFETLLTPNLKGLTSRQARIILEENDLSRGVVSSTYNRKTPKDGVIEQSPAPGKTVKRFSRVDLLVSMGRGPRAYMMPDLDGLRLSDAIPLIEKFGMSPGKIESVVKKNRPNGVILKQTPRFGYRVAEGTAVHLTAARKPGGAIRNARSAVGAPGLFRYRLPAGFLKRHVLARLKSFGLSIDLYDDFVKPGEELWCIIPSNEDATLLFYLDGELVETRLYNR